MAIPLWEGHWEPAPPAKEGAGSAEAWQAFLDGGWMVTHHALGPTTRTLVALAAPGLQKCELLTAEELRMAALRARAESVKVIAAEVGCSTSSASCGVQSALRKLRLHSAADLVGLFSAWPDSAVARMAPHEGGRRLMVTYQPPVWSLPECLSPAEQRVVRGLLAGESQGAIARAHATAHRTVANQVASIHRKLEVRSRLELFVALTKPRASASGEARPA